MRKPYRSDLTDAQWKLIRPLLPPAKSGGRSRTVDLREVVNTRFYQARTCCQWDYLPHDLAPKGTVWDYFVRLAPRRHLAEDRRCPSDRPAPGRWPRGHPQRRLH